MISMILLKNIFIVLQSILLVFMVFHDWISVRPFNDIDAIKKAESISVRIFSTIFNSLCVAIPLYLTMHAHVESIFTILCFYGGLTVGTILSWWIPYIFGSSAVHKQQFARFKNTHHFLPARGDHVTPNSLHVVLHVLVWSCFGLSLYFYLHIIS